MKKPAPKTIVVDPRAARLAEIDTEIARLRGIASAKQAELDAACAKMLEEMDHELQSRLDREIKGVRSKIDALNENRFAIELHDEIEDKPAKARPSTPTTTAKWNLKEIKEPPEYPTGARAAGKDKEINAAFDRFRDFYLATVDRHFSKLGAPHAPVDLALLSVVCGMQTGDFQWLSARIAEAEQRISDLEERSKGVPYKGVWSPDVQYKAGSFVSQGGSLWHAEVDVKGTRPGDGTLWQLAVKRGRDARP